jgi:hypothetical protein
VLKLALDVTRLMLAFTFAGSHFPSSMRGLQVPAQTHVQRDCHAHHDQRAYTQDQEPPDHPHNGLGYQMIWQWKRRFALIVF